jgi:sialate O-acetylesterase
MASWLRVQDPPGPPAPRLHRPTTDSPQARAAIFAVIARNPCALLAVGAVREEHGGMLTALAPKSASTPSIPSAILPIAVAIALAPAALADLALDPLFRDHAVLQRDRPVPVSGWTAPAAPVEVEFAGRRTLGRAGADGRFSVAIGPFPASLEGRELVVRADGEERRVADLVVGEVWFCSGQSNMEWSVDASNESDRAKEVAPRLPIRSFKAPHLTANAPARDVPGAWRTATAETVGSFTAVGFWFGVDLARAFDLEVPIGLVDISWGGTRIEPWIPLDEMERSPSAPIAATARELAARIEAHRAVAPADREARLAEARAAYERASDEYWTQALAKDPGTAGGWASPAEMEDFPDGWTTATLPATYDRLSLSLEKFDGFVWFTREFTVPEPMAGRPAVLELGAIDDSDIVFIDGRPAGRTVALWNAPRRYELADGLGAGSHRIVVCVLDTGGQGGFTSGPESMRLVAGEDSIPLAGEWTWRRGRNAPQVRVPAFEDPSKEPGLAPTDPAAIYNAMMAPAIAYPARGAIWYQGESNAGEPARYRELLPLLMESWRAKSGNPDLAWGVVQLASFMPFVENEPAQGAWALLREAQFRGARAGKGGMVSATDLGDARDIHPRRKREVGERLGAWARATVYGEAGVAWQGPELVRAVRDGDEVRCEFMHADGLRATAGEPGGFAVAGADGVFHWATATVERSPEAGAAEVRVRCEAVPEPVEIVYAWQNNPERANMANGAGLPMIPFRTAVGKD